MSVIEGCLYVFRLGCLYEEYVIQTRVPERRICHSDQGVCMKSMLFRLGCLYEEYVIQTRVSV